MILTILIGLLGAFLNYEFTKWLKNHLGASRSRQLYFYMSQNELQQLKPKFLGQLRVRLLGAERAGRLFDQAVARYKPPVDGQATEVSDLIPRAFQQGDFNALVGNLTQGITA